jgi:hypothetical protein
MPQNAVVEKIKKVVHDLIKLEVITSVGEVTIELDTNNNNKVEVTGFSGTNSLVTKIDLVDGDITNLIGPRFAPGGDLENLRQFHSLQVEKGHAVIVTCTSSE